MSSFTRTIPAYKTAAEVSQVLAQKDAFVPLSFLPTRALAGDFIYLIYHGLIVGRARISAVESLKPGLSPQEAQVPAWAMCLVRYAGGWERPPREVPLQGHQGVRYLEAQALEYLDSEAW
jgi:hypothetical protein